MAIDIKVIPTLHVDEAIRFINNADEVMKSKERVDFSIQFSTTIPLSLPMCLTFSVTITMLFIMAVVPMITF